MTDRGGEQATDDSADGLDRHDDAVGLVAAVQDLPDERREQRGHDALARTRDQQEDRQQPQYAVVCHQPQPVDPLRAQDGEPVCGRRRGFVGGCVDAAAGADRGDQRGRDEEARRVDQSDRGQPAGGGHDPAQRRPDQPGQVAGLSVQRVGRDEPVVGDEPGQHRLLGRGEELRDAGFPEDDDEGDPDPAGVVHQQQWQQTQREQHVGRDHGAPAVPPVDEDAGHRAQQHLRDERREQQDRRHDRRVGQHEHVVDQPDAQDPVPDQRHQTRGQHQPQVAMTGQQPPDGAHGTAPSIWSKRPMPAYDVVECHSDVTTTSRQAGLKTRYARKPHRRDPTPARSWRRWSGPRARARRCDAGRSAGAG